MNNDYERGEEQRRYTMSSFNKDLKKMVGTEIDIADEIIEPAEPVVGLFLLVDGTTIVSQYTESIQGDTFTLDQPLTATIESSSMVEGTFSSSVAYDHWMPLAKGRKFILPKNKVITVSEPLDTLTESYMRNKNG